MVRVDPVLGNEGLSQVVIREWRTRRDDDMLSCLKLEVDGVLLRMFFFSLYSREK